MDLVMADVPEEKDVHVNLDNNCTLEKNDARLEKYQGRVTFHFMPASASWLNQVEIWFGNLALNTLKAASFTSAAQLKGSIEAFITRHNQKAEPFKWRRRKVRDSQIKNTIFNLRNKTLEDLQNQEV